jgi:DNA-binding Lrp family transcriptional regulator
MGWFAREKSKAQQMAELSCRRLFDVRREFRRKLRELKRVQRKAESQLERALLIAETTAEDIEDCEKRIAHAEKAMEALRSEHGVDSEVINLLVKRLKQVEALSDAEIAIANHRRAGATTSSVDREML